MFENNLWTMEPVGRPENTIQGDKYRFTLLTPCLIRMEYREDGKFEDRPTQVVWNRKFNPVDFRVEKKGEGFELFTDRMHVTYAGGPFTKNSLNLNAVGGQNAYGAVWYYGEKGDNLGGTARTLDEVDGECPLQEGIMSRSGCSQIDDSHSLVLDENGWTQVRTGDGVDIYVFAYGNDYKEALNDFYRLTGKTPMLPRYALGNWWSRYYAYTEDSYKALVTRFEKEKIPFSVGVLDMDWHLVEEVDPKYGSGWTGYTWNKKLFPDPKRFLGKLHDRGMHTTLNVHPADGVQGCEEMYVDMAKEMGVDYENEDPVVCDPASPKFMDAYFKYLHHPREAEGVDFWWIDWQQGSNCKVEGLDPLWIFNHFHYLDNKRDGRRPMTFSRYAGPGSHRYPIGFSGDTHITWESLDFQPYFTTTATNIGYGWWSHDIGGHMLGYKDDELTARWTQYGIFSPIMRLHSSCSEFNGKEPWRFKKETEEAMEAALRQRHCMIPYLYTMNYRSYAENMPLIEPMYYEYPENAEAYEVKNQYFFGSQLMAAPVTTPRIKGLNVAKTKVWFPEGIWYDIYTGMRYDGGRMLEVYRDLSSIPVFAKAGGILVCADADELDARSVIKNPDVLCVRVFPEADGEFELYEDDNESCGYVDGRCVTTAMKYSADKDMFVISPADGDTSLIPDNRTYKLVFERRTEAAADKVKVSVDGKEVLAKNKYDKENRKLIVTVNASTASKISVAISKDTVALDNQIEKRCFDFLNQAEIGFVLKDEIYGLITSGKKTTVILSELKAKELDTELYGVLTEILTA